MSEAAPLSHEQTLSLLQAVKDGDEAALETLVVRNTALVKSIVRKYLNRGTEYDDLFQIGSMGMIKAIRNFDPAYGVRFSTYAVPMIAGEIKRHLRDDGMIKVSRLLKELAARGAAAQEALGARLGRDASVNEIAEEIGEDSEDIVLAIEAARPHVSIYEPVFGEDSDTMVMDMVGSQQDEATLTVDKVLLKEILGSLLPRERQIIILRYFADKTQSEIASLLGVSQMQVSRLESRILGKLRDMAQ